MAEKLKTGINGFGRFGLHLLKYWLDRNEVAPWTINWINDDSLSLEQIREILLRDEHVRFNQHKIQTHEGELVILEPNGAKNVIEVSHREKNDIPWLGKPDIFFECSGKNTLAADCQDFLVGKSQQVMISATSWDAEQTLIYGFNHEDWRPETRTISYGSCTVNGYVPLAQWFHDIYGVLDSDVNVVHNVARHKMQGETLIRKFCTLEKQGPGLLEWLPPEHFAVNYTVVPYCGVSVMDFRFRVEQTPTPKQFIADFETAISTGPLKYLYGMDVADIGPEVYNCTTYSAVVIRNNIRILGDSIYLHSYFDTENSVNRYYDLATYIACQRLGLTTKPRREEKVTRLSRNV